MYMGLFRMAMMHTKLIIMKWKMFWDIRYVELIRDRSVDLEYLYRYIACFKMAIMHTKLIRMK
jgi:hypothetical protein